jgi:pimeloyl-ACP methyl ester carboxylesterase
MKRVLYLHGFASGPSSSKARYFREHLERAGAIVEVPDLAAGDFEHLTITGQLEVIGRVVSGAAIPIIGSSMGGYLAALYASRHPEVPKLVLMAPAFGFARRWAERLGPAQLEQWRRTNTMEVYHYGEKRQRSLGYQLLEDATKYEDYPDFHQPALIFHGAQDDVVPPAYSTEFVRTHPNAALEIVDSGHELLNVLEHMASKASTFLFAADGNV